MLQIADSDEKYLISRISKGEAVLVLGAGAVRGCKNGQGRELKLGSQLAEQICNDAGIPYENDTLPEVLDAVRLPTAQLNDLLSNEYKGCTPSDELKNVFAVPWRRIYTFNIDDAIEGARGVLSKQTIYPYNALHSKVSPHEGLRALHVVHLNGYVRELDKGVIFSKLDYDRRISQSDLGWYREAAEDHFRYCSIFIGTRLNEPLLWAELERIRESSDYSRSFLIIPDNLSKVQISSLANRGITVVRGTFDDFVAHIRSLFPRNLEWEQVIASESGLSLSREPSTFSKEEVDALSTARRVSPPSVAANWLGYPEAHKQNQARDFFMGRPPSWELAGSEVPVDLAQYLLLQEFLKQAIDKRSRFAVITGQAGSGKTTAIMRKMLHVIRSADDIDLIEILPDTAALTLTLRAARKFSDKKFTVFFVPDLYPYGGSIRADIQKIDPEEAILVSTCRETEWHGNFKRYLGPLAKVFEIRRFSAADEPELIGRLEKYVPSPNFAKLKPEEKLGRLRASRRQLLIALREVTDSPNFDGMMRDEYAKLEMEGKKKLFGIAAVSTLARAGIRPEMAYSAYQLRPLSPDFHSAFEGLTGLVFSDARSRLSVRHEVYGRYILEEVMPFREIIDVVSRILAQFTKYEVPIIRSASRLDAALFKFLLNHNFLFDLAKAHDVKEDGLKIYRNFEVPFQLDGHFWLQYGLYFDRLDDLANAEAMLRKSIQAYPENAFAEHALARTRLRIAGSPATDDVQAGTLMADAVAALNRLDSRDPTVMDEYPLVTLSFFHIDAVIRRGDVADAKEKARDYLERLKYMGRRTVADSVTAAIEQLTIFVASGDWRSIKRHEPFG